jgi:amino acid adenylation domain-containing protein
MTKAKEPFELINSLSPEKRALVFRALKQEAVQAQLAPVTRRNQEHQPIPLSFSQHRLWMVEQLRPGGFAYNELAAFRLDGALDIAVLEQSINEIIHRHEALRTTFPTIEGNPAQVIAATGAVKLTVEDLSHLPEGEQEAEIQRFADIESRRPFDLARGPLLRVTLLQFGLQQNVMLVTAHHIILDGWSIGVFRSEMIQLYGAFSAGLRSPLRDLPIQYADYAIWQRQQIQQDFLKAQLDYWTRKLNNLPPLLQLPIANPRPEIESFRGARHRFNLKSDLSKQLRALSQRENVTLFITLLASFKTLLYRYSNQTDIPVGTVIANRNQAEVEQLIGFFVNTLVLRTDLNGQLTFRQLLQRVGSVALDAYEHQEMPFEYLVEALQPERSLSYNPLFQVMFILQNTPKQEAKLQGLTITTIELDSVTAKFDLTLTVEETPQGVQGVWEYNSDLFEPDAVGRMSGHLQTILEAIVANPDQTLAHLPLLTRSERDQILVSWNQTLIPYPDDNCIHQLFELQTEQSPDAIALVFDDQSLTYRELNYRANELAHHLHRLGVGAESLVGVCLQRSVEMVVALLAVLKAGGAYVPLDPSNPRQRLSYMLEDASLSVLLTQHSVWGEPSSSAEVIYLDSEWEAVSENGRDNPSSKVTSDNLAYVIYTSGSTGKPKGVLVSHKNLVHSTAARWEYYRHPVYSFLLLSSFAFDSSVAGIFWTLTQGGTLVLPPENTSLDIDHLCELIASNQVSHLLAIPAVYSLLLQQAEPEHLVSLQAVILAGEACPTRVIEQHRQALEHASIFNEYGPTETTVWSSVYRCESKQLRKQVPVGRPIPNTQIYVLDADLEPLPVGVPGEIYIGGAGVARGYLNQPELTAEKFIPHGLSDIPDARLYKTGDLGRYSPDGNIELLGRVDHQVKIRGFRIELGEIEAVLLQHENVREAVATVREDEQGNKRLVGYLSVKDSGTFSITELRNYVRDQLPGAATPSEFVLLDELPRLPNGKMDRKSLPEPEGLSLETEEAPQANWSGLEQSLAGIWQDILSTEAVDLDVKFFDIGGDSISIIRVFNRLREIIDKEIAITDLFKHQTIRSLAEFLEK